MAEKHIPMRMCVVSREMLPKSDLVRLVVAGDSLKIDPSQKMDGRGCYLKKDPSIIAQAKKKHSLNRVLKKNVPDSFYDELEAYVNAK